MADTETNERIPYRGGVNAATIVPQVKIGVARDNLVCFVCGAPVGSEQWTILSAPDRKGLVVFACQGHIAKSVESPG